MYYLVVTDDRGDHRVFYDADREPLEVIARKLKEDYPAMCVRIDQTVEADEPAVARGRAD